MNTYTNLFLSLISQKPIWSIQIAIIMIACNLICVSIGRYAIKVRSLSPSITVWGIEGLGLPELLATTSLGHVIGVGTIVGLKSIGAIY